MFAAATIATLVSVISTDRRGWTQLAYWSLWLYATKPVLDLWSPGVPQEHSHFLAPQHGQAAKVARKAAPLQSQGIRFLFPSPEKYKMSGQEWNLQQHFNLVYHACTKGLCHGFTCKETWEHLQWKMDSKGCQVRSVAVTVQVAEFRDKGSSLAANWISRIAVARYTKMHVSEAKRGQQRKSFDLKS